ncbi:hypothetical protein B0T21DRAFT_365465 [Apiosordaria backusii]|uniref:Uncharacterized protein n=1 Tax=Apiosordaria backusii TaxID=314023 RepID=A0AA40EDK6_9PEZI|nr:hypothetical protein B0T21DRAFT_365465 [Apiosordaria backusii]
MFCGLPHHHHNSHRALRSFRSHTRLRSEAASPSTMHFRHHHSQPSSASSLPRSSMESSVSRPSTSGGKSELSVDWDPLRLHPPLACAPVPHLPEETSSRRYQPHELRQARSMHNLRAQQQNNHTSRHNQQAPTATVIYGGFDFGFDTSRSHKTSARRPPSPTPSTASDASSLDGIRDAEEWGDNFIVTPLPAPRRRPHPQHTAGQPAALAEAENFIKRGGWKRRGIVFVSDTPALAPEEETWEI